jgi:hypothetical protein
LVAPPAARRATRASEAVSDSVPLDLDPAGTRAGQGELVERLGGQRPGGGVLAHLRTAERARGAVLLASRPGLAATPPGGERQPDAQLVHEQRDGVTVLWSLRTAGFFREEQDDLIARAVRFARERKLV